MSGGSSTRVSSASTCTELSAEINDSTSVCGVLASIGIDTCLSSAISNPVLEVLLGTQTLSVCHGCTAEVLILAEHVVDADGTTAWETGREATLSGAQGSHNKAEKSGGLHFDGCKDKLDMMSAVWISVVVRSQLEI